MSALVIGGAATTDGATASPRLPLLCAWLLMLVTFSAPGREEVTSTGSLDVIASGKVVVRVVALALAAASLFQSRRHARFAAVVQCLLPLGAYVAWAFLSAVWSPLPAVSIGQAAGLLVQVLLAAAVAIRCGRTADLSIVLLHLVLSLLLIGSFLLIVDRFDHTLSGLDREVADEERGGLVHPTSAGATASLGLVVLVAVRLLWGWRWTRLLLFPGVLVFGALLFLAASRMADFLAAALVVGMIWAFGNRLWLALLLFTLCVGGAAYVTVDPGWRGIETGIRSATAHLERGESAEQLSTLTGRTALWEAVWQEFQAAPLLGHGYFVTSHDALLDVWSGPANRTAHNVALQALVTTGVFGAALLLWGLLRPVALLVRTRRQGDTDRRLLSFLAVVGLWYLGWGQLCESFLGPVQPESVVFFVSLGLLVARATGAFAAPSEEAAS